MCMPASLHVQSAWLLPLFLRVLMVLGAGRGPLVNASLRAAKQADRRIKLYAVEKNPNAVVTWVATLMLGSLAPVPVFLSPPDSFHLFQVGELAVWRMGKPGDSSLIGHAGVGGSRESRYHCQWASGVLCWQWTVTWVPGWSPALPKRCLQAGVYWIRGLDYQLGRLLGWAGVGVAAA